MTELESVKIGKCQNWKVSESESVRIYKCQNRKVSEFESVRLIWSSMIPYTRKGNNVLVAILVHANRSIKINQSNCILFILILLFTQSRDLSCF